MARWEPGAPERLQQAALELFAARGYEQTTATDIARAVGLTERTFYRHFSDKREALFHGQDRLADALLAGLDAAPPGAAPMEAVASARRSAAAFFPDDRRARSRTRQSVIDGHPALRERERHKLAGLATALADALRARGVPDPAATLAAESGMTVFGLAFTQWLGEGEQRSFADIAADVLRELVSLVGEAPRLR